MKTIIITILILCILLFALVPTMFNEPHTTAEVQRQFSKDEELVEEIAAYLKSQAFEKIDIYRTDFIPEGQKTTGQCLR